MVVLITTTTLATFGIDVTSRPSLRLVVNTIMLQGVTFGGLALLYLKVRDLDYEFVQVGVPDSRDVIVTVVGTVTLLSLLFAASTVISLLGIESAQNQIMETGQKNPEVFLLLVPLSFLIVGPGEELLYRGIVQGTLQETLNPARAVVLASALFASIHLFSLSGEGKFIYIGITFLLALVLGAAYVYTGNLAVPAVIHGAYNAVQFGGAYLAATGGF
ncbi:MAG: lysostaphin resistance A-like protein [Halopenitus sp.]